MAKSRIVKMNEKIAEKATNAFSMSENTVVGEYSKIEDAFVDRYLTKDGETITQAKERLKRENKNK